MTASTPLSPADDRSAPVPAVDTIDRLLGPLTARAVAALRARRPVTRDNLQASHDALLTVGTDAASLPERLAVAAFTAELHGDHAAAEEYAARLRALDAPAPSEASVSAPNGITRTATPGTTPPSRLADAVLAAAASARTTGPYGTFASAALCAFDEPGPEFAASDALRAAAGARLAAALAYAHLLVLHPRDASPARLDALHDAGWSTDGIVTLSQLIAFLSCQLRVVAGLAALAGAPRTLEAAPTPSGTDPAASAPAISTRHIRRTDGVVDPSHRPTVFTRDILEWEPWLDDVAEGDLTDVQRDALIDAGRAKSPYFRLLARDPGILKTRTLADKDIFFNTRDGLPRAERELCAVAVSRSNGCLFCASVHSRFAAHYSKRPGDVQRLLDEGAAGTQEPRWRALIDAATALTRTPAAFTPSHVQALQGAGLSVEEIGDAVHAAAFFAWANRLMLALGEPRLP